MYRTVFFDLDGTITESGIGITRSVAYALKKYGIEEQDQQKLDLFIGPPLIDSFMKHYGFSKEQAVEAVAHYREYYAVTGIFENRVYDGVRELLAKLNAAGVRCVLATSKPEHYALQILEHFDLSKYFPLAAGATMDERRTNKTDVLAYAMEKAGCTPGASAVMVGDREHDVLGAKQNGLSCIGVLYGYGSREELTEAGALALAETPYELAALLL